MAQLDLLKNELTDNCVVMGDFNLDARIDLRLDYQHRVQFEILSNFALNENLIQIIDFTTWLRIINGIMIQFLHDHVY